MPTFANFVKPTAEAPPARIALAEEADPTPARIARAEEARAIAPRDERVPPEQRNMAPRGEE